MKDGSDAVYEHKPADRAHKMRLAVLISGRGSNLQALIDACADPAYPAEIAVVIANMPDAYGLERAASAGLSAMIVDHRFFKNDKPGFEKALADTITAHRADLVCLAGFMRILSAGFLARFPDRVINIHPSLLPAHKGLDTHRRVIAAGDTEHGCTVHVVTDDMDSGAVIVQRRIAVNGGESAETLAQRVLAEEHVAYPEAVRRLADGSIRIHAGCIEEPYKNRHTGDPASVVIKERPLSQPSESYSADPEALARARLAWTTFIKGSIIAGGVVVLTLALLALFVA